MGPGRVSPEEELEIDKQKDGDAIPRVMEVGHPVRMCGRQCSQMPTAKWA